MLGWQRREHYGNSIVYALNLTDWRQRLTHSSCEYYQPPSMGCPDPARCASVRTRKPDRGPSEVISNEVSTQK